MAQLLQPFDARQHDPSQSAGNLPVGKHPVIIETSEVKANNANTGGFLELGLKVIDGPSLGASGAYRLNLYNASAKAVEIAHNQLSAICHSIGVFNVSDSAQLHNIPFLVEIGYQKGHEPGSGPEAKGYTEVKRVFDRNGNEPGKAGQAAPAQQPAQAPMQQPAQQQPQAQQPTQAGPAWGGGAPQQSAPAPAAQTPAWGQGQPAQQAQAPAQQPAWGQQAPQGAAPWGAPR